MATLKRAKNFISSKETYVSMFALLRLFWDGMYLLSGIYFRRLFKQRFDKQETIKFSVIMPCYNRKQCIDDAITSVLKQTNQSFELIIIDDGSEDGSVEYIQNTYHEELSNEKIKLIPLGENKGVCHARNVGLQNANGEIICYLDSDNKWCRWYLDYIATAYTEDSKVMLAYTAMLSVNLNINACKIVGKKYDFEQMMKANYIDMNVFSHRKTVFQLYGGFDNELRRLVDYELIMRYSCHYIPLFLNRIGAKYYYRRGLSTITSSKELSYETHLKIVHEKLSEYTNKAE